jgi:hypothetical protein
LIGTLRGLESSEIVLGSSVWFTSAQVMWSPLLFDGEVIWSPLLFEGEVHTARTAVLELRLYKPGPSYVRIAVTQLSTTCLACQQHDMHSNPSYLRMTVQHYISGNSSTMAA